MKPAVAIDPAPRRSRARKPRSTVAGVVDLTPVMTVEQAALAANVSVATIWRWRNQGVIKGQRMLGRTVFDRSEVEAVLRNRAD
jgi:predicted DNA-binding transcriptional regulator AlpA